MAKYAEKTEVNVDKSRAEIERTLTRYGASSFLYGWEGDRAAIGFEVKGRKVRISFALPKRDDYLRDSRGYMRADSTIDNYWTQAMRQRWRAVALWVKAKLEAIDSGFRTFEQEFLADIVLPDNSTVAEYLAPQLEAAYSANVMPKLIPGIGETGAVN